jgi:hypothetical protein
MVLPVGIDYWEHAFDKWQRGALVQNVFPTLTSEELEFLISGSTPQDWADTFPPEEEQENG